MPEDLLNPHDRLKADKETYYRAERARAQYREKIRQSLPQPIQEHLATRTEESQQGILGNMASMTEDERLAYGRSLIQP